MRYMIEMEYENRFKFNVYINDKQDNPLYYAIKFDIDIGDEDKELLSLTKLLDFKPNTGQKWGSWL